MNPLPAIDREALFRLFAAASRETITEADSAALAAALASSPEARKLWFLYQDMELGLEEWAASRSHETAAAMAMIPARPIIPQAPARTISPHTQIPRRTGNRWLPRLAAAATLAAAVGIALWAINAHSAARGRLATLTRSVSARWTEDRITPATPLLSNQALDLASGIVELSMSSGALVVFEGPGRMEILTANSIRLHSGRIHATVPPSAKGFTINSNGFSVIDHGTEFGCVAPEAGTAEIHVFHGDVELKPVNLDSRWLQKNQALALKDGALEPITARPELFISPADLDRQTTDSSSLRNQASRMLEKHPAAVVYFNASRIHANTLPNTATDPASPITIHNCMLTTGRHPGHRALLFDGKSSFLTLQAPSESHSLTLIAWLRSDDSSARQDLISATGPLSHGEIAWYRYRQNRLGFGTFTPIPSMPGRGWRSFHSPTIPSPLSDWSMLATVVDTKAKTITHYLNGKSIGVGHGSLPSILRLGSLQIGTTIPNRDTPSRTHHFQGAIDEFAIIATPLSSAEITRLYQLGRPDPQKTSF